MLRAKGLVTIGFTVTYLLSSVLLAGAAPAGPLAQVIEGAKKEGTVTIKLVHGFTDKSMYRLEKGIKDKYGVQLQIKYTGATDFNNDVVEAVMEQKAGAIPSYDMLSLSNHVSIANKAGVLERVDWKPLLSEGTNPAAVHDNSLMHGAIVYASAHIGLIYNPEKVKPDEVPKKLADLANPKWKDKVAIETAGSSLVRWCFILGKESVISTIRAILKNGAIHAQSVVQSNRYAIGEVWFCRPSSTFLGALRKTGMPASWQSLDFADITEFSAVVRKGARHPNAAKLAALYLASPEGARFGFEEGNYGSLYYPGNYEHDIRLQNQKQGIPEVFGDRKTELLEFYGSKEGGQLRKELALILQTGGGH